MSVMIDPPDVQPENPTMILSLEQPEDNSLLDDD